MRWAKVNGIYTNQSQHHQRMSQCQANLLSKVITRWRSTNVKWSSSNWLRSISKWSYKPSTKRNGITKLGKTYPSILSNLRKILIKYWNIGRLGLIGVLRNLIIWNCLVRGGLVPPVRRVRHFQGDKVVVSFSITSPVSSIRPRKKESTKNIPETEMLLWEGSAILSKIFKKIKFILGIRRKTISGGYPNFKDRLMMILVCSLMGKYGKMMKSVSKYKKPWIGTQESSQ